MIANFFIDFKIWYLISLNIKYYFVKGCLIPPEDLASESAHYVARQDTLSLTNFALMDEDDEEESINDNKQEENTSILTAIGEYQFDRPFYNIQQLKFSFKLYNLYSNYITFFLGDGMKMHPLNSSNSQYSRLK